MSQTAEPVQTPVAVDREVFEQTLRAIENATQVCEAMAVQLDKAESAEHVRAYWWNLTDELGQAGSELAKQGGNA